MNHRCYWKATVCILFSNRLSLFPTNSNSVSAFRLQSPRFFSLNPHHNLLPKQLPSLRSPLQATKDSRERFDQNEEEETMIVRVRSNLGTVKLTIDNEETATEATIRSRILEDLRSKTSNTYALTQGLSFDPAGARKIDLSKTLSEQGIRHGCMVYCRVEEAASTNHDPNNQSSVEEKKTSPSNTNKENNSEVSGKKEPKAKKSDEVIDLIDSSDDEEVDQDDDSDDEVQVISPPRKMQKERQNQSLVKPTSTSRKRQRSSTDGSSGSTKAVGNKGNSNRSTDSNFQIVSYNVWFGPPDPEARQVFPKERMNGIVESLLVASKNKEHQERQSCPLLFVGLQELTPNLVQYLQPLFQGIGYKLCTQPIGGFGPSYGIGIAVPEDANILERRFVPYQNSIQGRGFLFVRTPTVLFVTTHLESWCGPQFTGAKEREIQIVEAADFCREQLLSAKGLELAIIAGDLNWDDERTRKSSEAPNKNLLSLLPNGWKDAGTPFDHTYDAKENPMLSGNLRRRLDRCLYMSKKNGSKGYESKGLQKIGKEAIPNLVWNKRNSYNNSVKKMAVAPSDHFGIMIHFSDR